MFSTESVQLQNSVRCLMLFLLIILSVGPSIRCAKNVRKNGKQFNCLNCKYTVGAYVATVRQFIKKNVYIHIGPTHKQGRLLIIIIIVY